MKNATTAILTCVPLALMGCGRLERPVAEDLGTTRASDQADALPKTDAERLADALSQEKSLAQRQLSEGNYLGILRGINRKFCVKLTQLRAQCPSQARLLADDVESVLGCVADADQAMKLKQKFTVSLSDGPVGVRWRFSAENTYVSQILSAGADQEVVFHQNLGQSLLAPRLNEVADFRLIPVDAVPAGSPVLKVDFKVGTEAFFRERDLIPVAGSDQFKLDPGRLFDLRKSNACIVTTEELDAIAAEVKDGSGDAPVAPSSNMTAVLAANGTVTEQATAALARVEALKKVVAPVSAAVDAERARNSDLRKEITKDTNMGCFATQPIQKIEIFARGIPLPNSVPDLTDTKLARASQGSPTQFQFWFGDGLGAILPDETQQSLFQANGQLTVQGLSSRKIADMEYATISKGGVGAFAIENCTTVFGMFKRCTWSNGEANMYRLDGLTLKVNDEILYQNDNVDFRFQKGTLQWNENRLRANPAYVRLMNRSDCPSPGNGG